MVHLGEVSNCGQYFLAWKEGFLVGTYQTFEAALEALWKERLNARIHQFVVGEPV